MKVSLELQYNFFPEVSIKANPRFDASGREDGTTLSAVFAMGPTEKDPNTVYAQLRITTIPDQCENEPYHIAITAFALFKRDDDASIDTSDQTVRRMAAQILVGSSREMISIIASRGPFPGFGVGLIPFSKIRGIAANEDEAVEGAKGEVEVVGSAEPVPRKTARSKTKS